jgi:hypothetical protein
MLILISYVFCFYCRAPQSPVVSSSGDESKKKKQKKSSPAEVEASPSESRFL